jgi:hypothetical protein
VTWPWPLAADLPPQSEHRGCLHDAEIALRQHLDPAVRGGLEHQRSRPAAGQDNHP